MKSKPINTNCPWSGDPISLDSCIQYRGQTVAFCNPDCRDKFAAALKMFDEAIVANQKPVLEPTNIPAYKPRATRFDQVLTLEDIRLKIYHVTAQENEPIEVAIASKAIALIQQHLPDKVNHSGGAHGVGYVILHRGVTDHWLLMHWWGGGDIALASLARLKGGEMEFEFEDDTHVHACVWEHAVIAHERDAWVRTMMTGKPNSEAYLKDCLADGLY